MKNPERALATIIGEVHGIFMAMQVMARTHPAPNVALDELSDVEQMGLASLEPHPIPDSTIEGFRHAVSGIRKALEANPKYIKK